MCQACWKRDPRSWRTCGRCGELRPSHGRDPSNQAPVCARCWRRERPTGTCQRCGSVGRLGRTGARGGPVLCDACAADAGRGRRACGRCGEVRPVATREGADGTRDLCFACYEKTPRRLCGGCGQLAAIKVRGRDGAPDLCTRCAKPPLARCHVCGRERPCIRASTETPVCGSCRPRRVAACAGCGREQPVKARSAIGPLCGACQWRRLHAKALCERCGQLRRPALHPGSQTLCGDCAGIPQTRVCTRCGIEDLTYDRGLCPACSLHGRLADWRTRFPAEPVAQLDRYLTALERSPTPRGTLQWLAKPGGRTLADLAAGRVAIDHDALDQLNRGRSTADLRAALVHHGVLPARDEALASLQRWTTVQLTALPADVDAGALRAFARWKVIRELAERRGKRPGPDPLATTMPKRWITAAAALTTFLHEQHRTLADLDQPLLDVWLAAAPPSSRAAIRPFIAWLERQQRRGLTVPTTPGSKPVLALEDPARLHALRTLLTDDTITPRLRLAGVLLALYAQPVARIVRLTANDLHVTQTAVHVRLGDSPLAIPPALHEPAAEVLAAADPWLFPGQKAGLPVNPVHLARRLNRLGIPAARTRPTALAALSHQVPSPVLAELLGFSANTLSRASSELKIDYARYVARRT